MNHPAIPALKVIGAKHIEHWLASHPQRVLALVRQAYLNHAHGRATNPDSYFLRFPDSDRNRIIALPAVLDDEHPIAGIKWIASFPDNVAHGIDRASALLILNDRRTGYPLACLEGSAISAARTAASAAVGATHLHSTPGVAKQLGIVGCGPIAFRTVSLLVQLGWRIGSVCVHDLVDERAEHFLARCAGLGLTGRTATLEDTVRGSDLMVFATSAVRPNIDQQAWFAHAPTVLHLSLRDLAPEIVMQAQNVADNISHCLKANTSLDLAWQMAGHHAFIEGDIADAIEGRIVPDTTRPRIFSPFGMGVLDLAVARDVLDSIGEGAVVVDDFFPTPYQAEAHHPQAQEPADSLQG